MKKLELLDVDDFLHEISIGNQVVLKQFIEKYITPMSTYVLQNKGTKEDARDLMQESLYHLFRLSQKPKRPSIDNFPAYFRSMYGNLWLKQLKIKKRQARRLPEENNEVSDLEEIRYRKYRIAFSRLGKDCQQVLNDFLNGHKMEEIALRLDTSVAYAKRKKYLCKEQLKKMVNQ